MCFVRRQIYNISKQISCKIQIFNMPKHRLGVGSYMGDTIMNLIKKKTKTKTKTKTKKRRYQA